MPDPDRKTVAEAIEDIEARTLEEEPDSPVEEETPEEEQPEAVEVFGQKLTKEEWEEYRQARDNQAKMVASHTQRSQELADERRRIREEEARLRKQLSEVEYLKELARRDPEAAAAYLRGDEDVAEEVTAGRHTKELADRVARIEMTEQEKAQRDAMEKVRSEVISQVSGKDLLKDDLDEHVDFLMTRVVSLARQGKINSENWRSELGRLVDERSKREKSRLDSYLEKHGKLVKHKEKVRKMSAPRSSEGRPITPEPEANRVTPRRGGRVDWDKVTQDAISFEKERSGS